MEIQGKIKTIAPTVLRGASNFKTRRIILNRTSTYEGKTTENYTEISLLGDTADVPEQLSLMPGDVIRCDFNIKGRFFTHEGEEKFAQDVNVWNVRLVAKAATTTPPGVTPADPYA